MGNEEPYGTGLDANMMENGNMQSELQRLSLLKAGGAAAFAEREKEVSRKRLRWWLENKQRLHRQGIAYLSVLDQAYRTFYLEYLGLNPRDVPIVERTARRLVIHSYNACPVQQACEQLHLDTREVCKAVYERPVNHLLQQIHPDLRFRRNYDTIRPYAPYCEEIIELVINEQK